jgi:hypothetical protein
MRIASTCLLLLTGIGIRPIGAQTPVSTDSVVRVIATFSQGTVLRIGTIGRSWRIGALVRSDSLIVLSGPEAGAPIRVPDVATLDVRTTAEVPGLRVGAITGGALGGLTFAWLSYGICDAAVCHVDARATVSGVVLGAVAGGITGSVLGALMPAWRRVLP